MRFTRGSSAASPPLENSAPAFSIQSSPSMQETKTRAERFSPTDPLSAIFAGRASLTLGGVPDGLEGRVLARVAASEGTVLFVARDARARQLAAAALALFAPKIPALTLPAWDSLPYDRVSPNPEVSAERMSALNRLLLAHD